MYKVNRENRQWMELSFASFHIGVENETSSYCYIIGQLLWVCLEAHFIISLYCCWCWFWLFFFQHASVSQLFLVTQELTCVTHSMSLYKLDAFFCHQVNSITVLNVAILQLDSLDDCLLVSDKIVNCSSSGLLQCCESRWVDGDEWLLSEESSSYYQDASVQWLGWTGTRRPALLL